MEKIMYPSSYKKELEGKFLRFGEEKRKLQILGTQEVDDDFSADGKALEFMFLDEEGQEKVFRIRRNKNTNRLGPMSFFQSMSALGLNKNDWVEIWADGEGFERRYHARKHGIVADPMVTKATTSPGRLNISSEEIPGNFPEEEDFVK